MDLEALGGIVAGEESAMVEVQLLIGDHDPPRNRPPATVFSPQPVSGKRRVGLRRPQWRTRLPAAGAAADAFPLGPALAPMND